MWITGVPLFVTAGLLMNRLTQLIDSKEAYEAQKMGGGLLGSWSDSALVYTAASRVICYTLAA